MDWNWFWWWFIFHFFFLIWFFFPAKWTEKVSVPNASPIRRLPSLCTGVDRTRHTFSEHRSFRLCITLKTYLKNIHEFFQRQWLVQAGPLSEKYHFKQKKNEINKNGTHQEKITFTSNKWFSLKIKWEKEFPGWECNKEWKYVVLFHLNCWCCCCCCWWWWWWCIRQMSKLIKAGCDMNIKEKTFHNHFVRFSHLHTIWFRPFRAVKELFCAEKWIY